MKTLLLALVGIVASSSAHAVILARDELSYERGFQLSCNLNGPSILQLKNGQSYPIHAGDCISLLQASEKCGKDMVVSFHVNTWGDRTITAFVNLDGVRTADGKKCR